MAPDGERGNGQRESKERPVAPATGKPEQSDRHGQCGCRADRGERDVARNFEDEDPHHRDGQHGPRHEREEHAGRGGDAFAAFEPEPRRVVVTGDDRDCGNDSGPFGSIAELRGQPDCGETFECIDEKNKNTERFAQRAENIRRPNVPAAVFADVDAFGARHEVAGRNRAEQECAEGDEEKIHGVRRGISARWARGGRCRRLSRSL